MTRSQQPRLSRRATPSSIVRAGALVALASTAFSACDIPTALPRIETRFVVPGESTTLSVDQLLPTGVTVAGTSFRLELAARSIPSTTLGDMCAPCTTFHGQLVPKPGFTTTIPVTVPLPDQVESATLAGGSVAIGLTHNFGFDPLQPGGRTEDGSITVTVRSGAVTLGTTAITGPFPSGTTRTAAIVLQPGVISDDIDVTITVNSPAGGTAREHWVRIDTNAALSGTVLPGNILVSEARVVVPDQTVSTTATTIDLTDIDETMQDRVVRGAIVLDVDNPFTVAGTLVLRLSAGATTITKTVQVAAGETSQRVEFTGAELRSLLGNEVVMTLQGTLGSAAPVMIRPGDVIAVSSMLDLTFELGGTD